MPHDIFISYAHKDASDVRQVIHALEQRGYHVWYDGGIEAGSDWANSIGVNLESAKVMLLFLSKHSKNRENVQREIAFAQSHDIPILTVQLGKVRLGDELQRDLSVHQMVSFENYRTYGTFVKAIAPALEKLGVERDAVEEPKKDKKIKIKVRRIRRIIFWGIVLLIALACVLAKTLYRSVPGVVGLASDPAEIRVENAGYSCDVTMDYSDDEEYGYIFKQSEKGRTLRFLPVVLTQSLGPSDSLTTVPNTVGYQISDGVGLLVDAGMMTFAIAPVFDSEYAVSYIDAQSITAGMQVSSRNRIELSVMSEGEEVTFTYRDQTYSVPTNGKTQVSIGSDDTVTLTPMMLYDVQVSNEKKYWINDSQSLILDVDMNVSSQREETKPEGIFRGAVGASFTMYSEEENFAWNALSALVGDGEGNVKIDLNIDPFCFKLVEFDQSAYEAFVNSCSGDHAAKTYAQPICMYLGHTITLTEENFSTTILRVLSKNQELFSDTLPVIEGDQLYQDFSVVVEANGNVDVTFYGDSVWAMGGTASAKE